HGAQAGLVALADDAQVQPAHLAHADDGDTELVPAHQAGQPTASPGRGCRSRATGNRIAVGTRASSRTRTRGRAPRTRTSPRGTNGGARTGTSSGRGRNER